MTDDFSDDRLDRVRGVMSSAEDVTLPDDLRLLAGTSAEHDAVLQIRIDTPRIHAP